MDVNDDDWINYWRTEVSNTVLERGTRNAVKRVRSSIEHPKQMRESNNLRCMAVPYLFRELNFQNVEGALSAVQVQTVAFAIQALLKPPHGFFLGDGTGTGKSRIMAGIALEFHLRFPQGVIIYVTRNLILTKNFEEEAERVWSLLSPIQLPNPVRTIIKCFSYCKLTRQGNIADVINCNPSQKMLIMLDEAHCAGNRKSATFNVISQLQNLTPNALTVYSTATAASNVHQMGYMVKLGLWGPGTPYASYDQFRYTLQTAGEAAMELTAVNLKARGRYVCRQLKETTSSTSVGIPLQARQKFIFDRAQHLYRGHKQVTFLRHVGLSLKTRSAIPTFQRYLKQNLAVIILVDHTGESWFPDSICTGMLRRANASESELDEMRNLENPIDIIRKWAYDNGYGIAELTGRRLRPTVAGVSSDVMIPEKVPLLSSSIDSFNRDEVQIAIASRTACTGLSLDGHIGGRRRVMCILEIPWSEKAYVQAIGRIERSNTGTETGQRCILWSQSLLDESVTLARLQQRLRSLAALTRADACESPTEVSKLERFQAAEWKTIFVKLYSLKLLSFMLFHQMTVPYISGIASSIRDTATSRRNLPWNRRQTHASMVERVINELSIILTTYTAYSTTTCIEALGKVFLLFPAFAQQLIGECSYRYTTLLALRARGLPSEVCRTVVEYSVSIPAMNDVNSLISSIGGIGDFSRAFPKCPAVGDRYKLTTRLSRFSTREQHVLALLKDATDLDANAKSNSNDLLEYFYGKGWIKAGELMPLCGLSQPCGTRQLWSATVKLSVRARYGQWQIDESHLFD